jgi:hypothetical protein
MLRDQKTLPPPPTQKVERKRCAYEEGKVGIKFKRKLIGQVAEKEKKRKIIS